MIPILFSPILCLSLLAATLPEPEVKTLIVPIFSQASYYRTKVSVIEALGRPVAVTTQQFKSTGRSMDDGRLEIGADAEAQFTTFFGFDGDWVDHGWARLTYPADRELHVVATVEDYRAGEKSANVTAVAPGPAFRLSGWYRTVEIEPGGETALAIVNPTESRQNVTVVFHRRYPEPRKMISRTWTIEAMHRMSRFLSELVPAAREKTQAECCQAYGVIHIQGESLIAVGALEFFWETGHFRSVPIVATSPTLQAQ